MTPTQKQFSLNRAAAKRQILFNLCAPWLALFGVVTIFMGATQAMALQSTARAWQDRVLTVPYAPFQRAHPDHAVLFFLRQDYEQLERNQSILKTPMRIGSRSFEHGIGTHAVSHLRVYSPEPIARFASWVGIDKNGVTAGGLGSAVFYIVAGRKEIYRSRVMRGAEEPERVEVETGGVQVLDLHVGDDGRPECDHADWAEATLTLRNGKTVRLDELPFETLGIAARYPFSFTYGGLSNDVLLERWTVDSQKRQLDRDRTEVVTTWTDPTSGLRVRWEAVRYADYPAVEWLLCFENTGPTDTPILEDIQSLDMTLGSPLSPDTPFRLHRTNGSHANATDFEPAVIVVDNGHEQVLRGGSGKSSAVDFPFFKIETGEASTIFAVGWSGQWLARLQIPDRKQLRVSAGLELTHFALHPGEKVRTPRMLVFTWKGDTLESNAQFRQLIYQHYAAVRDGKKPQPILFCNTCFTRGGLWLNECNAENQISLIKAYAPLGLEALLTDAGWFEGGWPAGAGNWTPRKDAYPNGMAPVAAAAREHGMVYGLWFEPERVVAGTEFHVKHPEWVLSNGVQGERTLLANFGLREVQDYFFNIVKGYMDLPGFRFYRQDFNMFPLNWWRHNDVPDRQGITEMKYVEGLYAYWDRIAEAWPDSLREECASGGMRIDLETVRRMHIHQKTDYWFDNEADQSQIWGLNQYLPNNVVAAHVNRLDDYSFHSTLCSSLCPGWIADAPDFDVKRARRLLDRYRSVRHLLIGAWYPLLPYTRSLNDWMVSQYHRPDLREGLIVALRHPESSYRTVDLKLRGLEPKATYELMYDDVRKARERHTGAELMRSFLLTIPQPHQSVLITYRPAREPRP